MEKKMGDVMLSPPMNAYFYIFPLSKNMLKKIFDIGWRRLKRHFYSVCPPVERISKNDDGIFC